MGKGIVLDVSDIVKQRPRARGKGREWIPVSVVRSEQELQEWFQKDGHKWTTKCRNGALDGFKQVMVCKHPGCPAHLMLHYHSDRTDVTIMKHAEHVHNATEKDTRQRWGLPDSTKKIINELYLAGVKKAHQVELALERMGIKGHSHIQIVSHVNRLKNEKPTGLDPQRYDNRKVCEHCRRTYKNEASLRTHLQTRHRVYMHGSEIPTKIYTDLYCLEDGCDFSTRNSTGLRNHLQLKHGMIFDVQELNMANMQDVVQWRTAVELEADCQFVRLRGSSKKAGVVGSFYRCNGGGDWAPGRSGPGGRARGPGSHSLDSPCPAFIRTEQPSRTAGVRVTFCTRHYGHEQPRIRTGDPPQPATRTSGGKEKSQYKYISPTTPVVRKAVTKRVIRPSGSKTSLKDTVTTKPAPPKVRGWDDDDYDEDDWSSDDYDDPDDYDAGLDEGGAEPAGGFVTSDPLPPPPPSASPRTSREELRRRLLASLNKLDSLDDSTLAQWELSVTKMEEAAGAVELDSAVRPPPPPPSAPPQLKRAPALQSPPPPAKKAKVRRIFVGQRAKTTAASSVAVTPQLQQTTAADRTVNVPPVVYMVSDSALQPAVDSWQEPYVTSLASNQPAITLAGDLNSDLMVLNASLQTESEAGVPNQPTEGTQTLTYQIVTSDAGLVTTEAGDDASYHQVSQSYPMPPLAVTGDAGLTATPDSVINVPLPGSTGKVLKVIKVLGRTKAR